MGYSRVWPSQAAGPGLLCSGLFSAVLSMSCFLLRLPQHLGCAQSLISEASDVKMGANLTHALHQPYCLPLPSFSVLSILISSGDSALLEN